jgi:F0F1-type ATP synthase assembly protein I
MKQHILKSVAFDRTGTSLPPSNETAQPMQYGAGRSRGDLVYGGHAHRRDARAETAAFQKIRSFVARAEQSGCDKIKEHLGGIDMGVLIVGGVLFGTILGRFFKVYVLVPASALAIILVLAHPASTEQGLLYSLLEVGILVTSLQVGYVLGLVTGTAPLLEDAWKPFGQRASTGVSRSYHIR